jgi:hypothetical protein
MTAENRNDEVRVDVYCWATVHSLCTYPTQLIGSYGINKRSRDNE